MDLTPYLKLMTRLKASDLFFSPGAPLTAKVNGSTRPVGRTPLAAEAVEALARCAISDAQAAAFSRTLELNLALSVQGLGRFRLNLYRTRGDVAMVIRYVGGRIPSIESLRLPLLLRELVLEARGLVLITGAAGSGKSTTAAAMIDHRNRRRPGHILTVEDPIEHLHRHRRSVVDQREVGIDTLSYASALKNALREAPDVIFIGEIRNRRTMAQALAYAETGHLCLSTLHATSASHSLHRVVDLFAPPARHRLLQGLAANLRAVVAQRLVQGVDGTRLPAVEILLRSPYTAQLIAKGDADGLKAAMDRDVASGMQTFDQALLELYRAGAIGAEETLANADAPHDMRLKMRLSQMLPAHSRHKIALPGEGRADALPKFPPDD